MPKNEGTSRRVASSASKLLRGKRMKLNIAGNKGENNKLKKGSNINKQLVWNLFFATLAIAAIILAYYFYQAARSIRELTFLVNPIRTTVVKAGQSSCLEVSCYGQKIQSDVTAVKAAIWNNGKRPIESSDILEGIVLSTDPSVPILDVKLQPSREISGVSIDRQFLDRGQIPISWRILEKGDGGIIQIIFAGPPETNIQVSGIIKEQRNIRNLTYKKRLSTPQDQLRLEKLSRYFFLVMGLIYIGMGIIAIIIIVPKLKRKVRSKGIAVIAIIFGLAMLIWTVLNKPPIEPPFGF